MISTVAETSPRLARGVAARIRDAVEAAERLASFSFDADPAAAEGRVQLAEGEEREVARDFLLRVFRGASDRTGHRILLIAAARAEDGVSLGALAAELELPRMAASERVNALIQVGLVYRDLQLDAVRIAPAGEAIVALLGELEREVAEWLGKRRR